MTDLFTDREIGILRTIAHEVIREQDAAAEAEALRREHIAKRDKARTDEMIARRRMLNAQPPVPDRDRLAPGETPADKDRRLRSAALLYGGLVPENRS